LQGAYRQGLEDGKQNKEPCFPRGPAEDFPPPSIPHKEYEDAYHLGYKDGQALLKSRWRRWIKKIFFF